MAKLWHVGFAVPDLEQGMAEIGALFELTWRPVVTRSMSITDGSGHAFEVECPVTFSLGGPFAVEVWESIPGTPLEISAAGYFHHIGYWVDDFEGEKKRLEQLGYPPFLTSEPALHLSRGPGGICVEPKDVLRDMPYLRDLFPPDSEHHGEPVLPRAAPSRA